MIKRRIGHRSFSNTTLDACLISAARSHISETTRARFLTDGSSMNFPVAERRRSACISQSYRRGFCAPAVAPAQSLIF